jgi:hypothetical protein
MLRIKGGAKEFKPDQFQMLSMAVGQAQGKEKGLV